MGDLRNPRLIYVKGFLFLVIAVTSCGLILYEFGTPKLALLVAIAIWSSARFYYFAFYVIEHYVDPNYQFAGLGSFVAYLLGRPHQTPKTGRTQDVASRGEISENPTTDHADQSGQSSTAPST